MTLLFTALCKFLVIVLAANRVGPFIDRIKLPIITGFLFVGVIVGPHVFNFISGEDLKKLVFIDEASLSFIAFIAGGEIYLKEYKSRLKSINLITLSLVFSVFVFGTIAVFSLSSEISFMQGLPYKSVLAISMLAGSILVARSPSSAVAIIKEIRAKGPFTQMILGVTIITDVLVIIVFSMSASLAGALLRDAPVDFSLFILMFGELFVAIILGVAVGKFLEVIIRFDFSPTVRSILMIVLGYFIFIGIEKFAHASIHLIGFQFKMEPLLVCMVGGFFVANYTESRIEFNRTLHQFAPFVYLFFFTVTGVALQIDIIGRIWAITLIVVFVRMGAIFLGAYVGGRIAGDPPKSNRISWLGFLTQAGVSIGLSKAVAVEFPGWGQEFATFMISIIVVNQLFGPSLLKWSIFLIGEAQPKVKKTDPGLHHVAIVFGSDGRTVALARQLHSHHWKVIIAMQEARKTDQLSLPGIESVVMGDFSVDALKKVGIEEAGVVVGLFSDEDNFRLLEMIHQNYPDINLVVQLDDREYYDRFSELNASIVLASTAMISLLDHFVRCPSAVTLLLDMEDDQDIVDVRVLNPEVFNVPLRNVSLPTGIIIISAHRQAKSIYVDGNYVLLENDVLTMVGPIDTLVEIVRRLERIPRRARREAGT